jgi:DNA end-binding protein Ku
MARAMWRGAIQFGLVTIPVKLYLATEARRGLSFNLLHESDLQRISMRVHCPTHGEIPRSETVRGYEYAPDRYVVIEEADLEAVPLKTVRSIEIEQFVAARRDEHASAFVRQAYYLEPEAVGRKAFQLLRTVLHETGLQAICKIVLKDREHLAALDPFGPTLLLSTLYWPDEVRDLGELDLPAEDVTVKPAELAMARQLVETLTGEFDPSQYRDEYREALTTIIEAKVAGEPVPEAASTERPGGRITDLMAVLEASVAAARAESGTQRAQAGARKAGSASRAASAGDTRRTADGGRGASGRSESATSSEGRAPARRRKTA